MKSFSSKEEITKLELDKTYKEMLKGMEEKVMHLLVIYPLASACSCDVTSLYVNSVFSGQIFTKLNGSFWEQLPKAEASRAEAEQKMNETHKLSCDEISKLREKSSQRLRKRLSLCAQNSMRSAPFFDYIFSFSTSYYT